MLIESTKKFGSKAQAERGFVSLIKSVASNQYRVEFLEDSTNGLGSPPSPRGRCTSKARRSAFARCR